MAVGASWPKRIIVGSGICCCFAACTCAMLDVGHRPQHCGDITTLSYAACIISALTKECMSDLFFFFFFFLHGQNHRADNITHIHSHETPLRQAIQRYPHSHAPQPQPRCSGYTSQLCGFSHQLTAARHSLTRANFICVHVAFSNKPAYTLHLPLPPLQNWSLLNILGTSSQPQHCTHAYSVLRHIEVAYELHMRLAQPLQLSHTLRCRLQRPDRLCHIGLPLRRLSPWVRRFS